MHSSTPAPARPIAARVVLIADDHGLVREGIKLLVSHLLGSPQCLEAADAASLLRLVRTRSDIDLALVDLNMPGMEKGLLLPELARQPGCPALVVVSALTSPDVVRRALALDRVYAFVPKSAGSALMQQAIEAALQGRKLPFSGKPDDGAEPVVTLTPRLEQVRALVRQGMSNKLIASTLGISEGTVKNHMTEIFRALNVSNRTQAARHDPDIQ